jgi:enoyl-CoA hydratase/carnithine racemase
LRSKLAPIGAGKVSLSVTGRVARITLSQPVHKNAMSGKMMVELLDAVEHLEQNSEVAMVQVTGEGDFFCSGADLSVIEKIEGRVMCEFMMETTSRLRALPAVSVALINGGGCVGGGTELATACDLRLFAPTATWRCVHPKMGISPGWGGGMRLASILGRARAVDVLCNARKFSAEDCVKLGLCDGVAAPGQDLGEYSLARLSGLMEHSLAGVRACKLALAATCPAEELAAFTSVWGAKDFHDAVARSAPKHGH